MNAPAVADLVAGRYRLVERVATGGMGVVWRATDERLGREVALKLIRPEWADDPTFRRRLAAEARAIAAIRSPHVVRVYDVGEEEDPAGGTRSFLVMELVDGHPLTDELRAGPLTAERTSGVIGQVAAALAAAHQRGIVHRDIKPANIVVGPDDSVTVLDFGISRAADAVALTATDVVVGTARYLSPEQVNREVGTSASDVYSLGIVGYQCLTGAPPFATGSDVAIALAHAQEPVPPLPQSVPPELAELIGTMLAKNPAARPSAEDISQRLGAGPERTRALVADPATAAFAADGATAAVADPDSDLPRWLRPAPLAAAAAAALLVVVGAVVLGLTSGAGDNPAVATTRPTAGANAKVASETKPVAHQVGVVASRYVGRRWTSVRTRLATLGLPVRLTWVTSSARIGDVTAVSPTGSVTTGRTIDLSVAVRHPQPVHPPAAHHPAPHAKPVPPGHGKKPGKPKGPGKPHGDH